MFPSFQVCCARLASAWLLAQLFSCARIQVKTPQGAMRSVSVSTSELGSLESTNEMGSLRQALKEQLAFWDEQEKKKGTQDREDFLQKKLIFGEKEIDLTDYRQALRELMVKLNEKNVSRDSLRDYIAAHFDFYEVYGSTRWGEVLVTGYYEPVLKGYRKPRGKYTQPLYLTPKDLVKVRLDLFAEVMPSLTDWRKRFFETSPSSIVVRGRLKRMPVSGDKQNFREGAAAPIPMEVVPFPDRQEIDGKGALVGQHLEICYVDPIDAFFLQIQGSGRVDLDNGTSVYLTYAAQNGYPYYPIGKDLFKVIPKERMSLQSLREYLRGLPPAQQLEVLFRNPSYVFFQRSPQDRGITYQGTPVVGKRTIATDKNLFPKGAMAILSFESPQPETRIVFDQDTGGAIRGPGRVDFFWGSGNEAEQLAGGQKSLGRLLYLVPKKKLDLTLSP